MSKEDTKHRDEKKMDEEASGTLMMQVRERLAGHDRTQLQIAKNLDCLVDRVQDLTDVVQILQQQLFELREKSNDNN